MLGRQAIHAIKALLELAGEPQRWRSVRDLAVAQALPEPMLEQLLLQLRRGGLLEARRGRLGGYRLARPAGSIPLAAVLAALGHGLAIAPQEPGARGSAAACASAADATADATSDATADSTADATASDRVAALLEARLRLALERELAHCTLAELHFDLRSASAAMREEGGLLLG